MKSVVSYIQDIEEHIKPEIAEQPVRNQYAWWLLEHVSKQSKHELICASTITLSTQQEAKLHKIMHELVTLHKPIAYILGTVPFGPLSLMIRPPILIPRPETEEWVYYIVETIQRTHTSNITILDMCTGSGCIALLCATMLPTAHIYAVDISQEALDLAEQNKKKLGIENVTFMRSDLFTNLTDHTFDIILSNPPYVTAEEYAQLAPSVSAWEDKQALYAPHNGLAIIEQIIQQAPRYLKPNIELQTNSIAQLYIEIGWQQGKTVTKMMQNEQYTDITIQKDTAQKDRVVSGRIINVATTSPQ